MKRKQFELIEQQRAEAEATFKEEFNTAITHEALLHCYARYCGKLSAIIDAVEVYEGKVKR